MSSQAGCPMSPCAAPAALVSISHPALPQVLQQHQILQILPEQEHNREGCRALSTADICSSRDSETKDPPDKGTPSAHGPGC